MNFENRMVFLDKIKRFIFLKFEIVRFIIQFFKKSNKIPLIYKIACMVKMSFFKNYVLPTAHRNKCVKTGRSHSIFKLFKYSRFTLRHKAIDGDIPGLRRSCW